MEFLRERVYTAVNADELRAGDKVIVADTIMELRNFIEEKADDMIWFATIREILSDNHEKRFCLEDNMRYALAYLVERKENCTNCEYSNPHNNNLLYCDDDKIPIIIGGEKLSVCSKYKPKPEQKCGNCIHRGDCITSPTGCDKYVQEAPENYRPFKDTDELKQVWASRNNDGKAYILNSLDMPLIWVRHKDDDSDKGCLIVSYAITEVVISDADMVGASMQRLLDEYTFLDGSPCGELCGVEE